MRGDDDYGDSNYDEDDNYSKDDDDHDDEEEEEERNDNVNGGGVVSEQASDPHFQNERKQKPEYYIRQFSIFSMTGYPSFHSNKYSRHLVSSKAPQTFICQSGILGQPE